MPRLPFSRAAVIALMVAACGSSTDAVRQPFPRVGIAVRDSAGGWCAEFVIDSVAPSLQNGRRVTIVFPGPSAAASWQVRVAAPHAGECHAEFAQSRWMDYAAYRLELIGAIPGTGADVPAVALAVASEVSWVRDADGVVRADLDGDGLREEARRCLAGEGEHLTLRSPRPQGQRVRRWHEYYDWGAFVEPTCQRGEDGEDAKI
jgi:hypothetical protein